MIQQASARKVKGDLALQARDLALPISRGALETLSLLRGLQARCRVVCPSIAWLSERLGRSERSTQRYLSELAEVGAVVRLYRGGRARRVIYYVGRARTPGPQFDGWRRLGAPEQEGLLATSCAPEEAQEVLLEAPQEGLLATSCAPEGAQEELLEAPSEDERFSAFRAVVLRAVSGLRPPRQGDEPGTLTPPRSIPRENPSRDIKDHRHPAGLAARTPSASRRARQDAAPPTRAGGSGAALNGIPPEEWSRLWASWRWSWRRHQGTASYQHAPADPRVLAWLWRAQKARKGGEWQALRLARCAWLLDQVAARGDALWTLARSAHHLRALPESGRLADQWIARVTRPTEARERAEERAESARPQPALEDAAPMSREQREDFLARAFATLERRR